MIQASPSATPGVQEIKARSGFHANAFAKNTVCSDPAVDSTAIIADLEPFATDGLHEVQIFGASHLTQHDVSD
jgi:hypothetical protein